MEGDKKERLITDEVSRFLSTPSGWRATRVALYGRRCWIISIHALRVEGDIRYAGIDYGVRISIHALRVEGDTLYKSINVKASISIHALRVEGDIIDR